MLEPKSGNAAGSGTNVVVENESSPLLPWVVKIKVPLVGLKPLSTTVQARPRPAPPAGHVLPQNQGTFGCPFLSLIKPVKPCRENPEGLLDELLKPDREI